MDLKLDDLLPSVDRFMEAWRVVRLCPNKIDASKKQVAFNSLTLTICLAIFVLARSSVAGASRGIATDIFATIVSVFIAFMSGYVTLILDASERGVLKARKWSTFFSLLWMTSLLVVIVVDGVPIWNHWRPVTSIIIDALFVPGTLPALLKNTLRALVIGAAALCILLIKTTRMDPNFRYLGSCTAESLAFGLVMNTLLLLLFLYGPVI